MDFPSMHFHNIIAQTQTQSCSLPGRLGCEERLEDFVFDGVGDAGAVFRKRYLYPSRFIGTHCHPDDFDVLAKTATLLEVEIRQSFLARNRPSLLI